MEERVRRIGPDLVEKESLFNVKEERDDEKDDRDQALPHREVSVSKEEISFFEDQLDDSPRLQEKRGGFAKSWKPSREVQQKGGDENPGEGSDL